MSSPFAFVPRSVKRKQTTASSASGQGPTVSVSTPPPTSSTNTATPIASEVPAPPPPVVKDKEKEKELKTPTNEELAALACLSLSDYALWKDGDLRRRMEQGIGTSHDEDGDQTMSEEDDKQYVPLSYLLAHSHVFRVPETSPWISPSSLPQVVYAKAIRVHASNFLDVRLVLSPTRASSQLGHEVRRKDWKTLDQTIASRGKSRWDALTTYVENIPTHYRTTHGVLRFISSLLRPSSPINDACTLIQNIHFPPHYADLPSTVPICKGFALITLGTTEDVNSILKTWAWDRPDIGSRKHDGNPTAQDAEKYGFRAMARQDYENRKAEYLEYREQLQRDIAQFEVDEARKAKALMQNSTSSTAVKEEEDIQEPGPSTSISAPATSCQETKIHPNSPYPHGCLVYVRHVHPTTNKTTLRTLFSRRPATDQNAPSSTTPKTLKKDFLDYVDYTKGTDTCHLRVKSPPDAQELVDHFTRCLTVQKSGLDDEGDLNSAPDAKPIQMWIVTGRPEELYWEKVPEKVRKQAVQRALSALEAAGTDETIGGAEVWKSSEEEGRMSKRQKTR